MGQRRRLRVLIMGEQDNFDRVLATNIQCCGYEVVTVPSPSKIANSDRQLVEGDILLYDLDKVFSPKEGAENASFLQQQLLTTVLQHQVMRTTQYRFLIVLSSFSVARTTLEQLGAIALVQKPFEMGHLQRYLRVLQSLLAMDLQEETDATPPGGPTRVLVVDDDVDIARAVSHFLSDEPNFQVAIAHDGLEAVEKCLQWHPHCMVTDLLLPWMNGYQVIRCLSASSFHTMPIFVILSALTRVEGRLDRSYLADKRVVYINKPFDLDHVVTVVKHVCTNEGSNMQRVW